MAGSSNPYEHYDSMGSTAIEHDLIDPDDGLYYTYLLAYSDLEFVAQKLIFSPLSRSGS
jgi:hypothetical protein